MFKHRLLLSWLTIACVALFAACDDNKNEEPAPKPSASFTIEVNNITAVSADISVTPSDNTIGYFTDVLSDKDYQQTLQYGFDDYLAYVITTLSQNEGMPVEKAIEVITTHAKEDYTLTNLEPGSLYHAVAVGINTAGESVTEVTVKTFETQFVKPSENSFEITVSDVTERRAMVKIVPENNDPYFFEILPTTLFAELEENDLELGDYLLDGHMASGDLADFLFEGTFENPIGGLTPGWEYRIVVFGCEGGVITTEIVTEELKMLPGGDPATCTFAFDCTLRDDISRSTFVYEPSDPTVVYICDYINEEDYQALILGEGDEQAAMTMVLEETIEMYQEMLGGMRTSAISLISTVGERVLEGYVNAGEELRMWACPINQSGEPTAPFSVSELYKSPEKVVSDATVILSNIVWYDGAELATIDPEAFGSLADYAVVAFTATPSASAKNWYASCFYDDLTDRTDRTIINNLVNYGSEDMKNQTEYLIPAWWGVNTVCAVAEDAEGNYGEVLREVIDLTKEGATLVPDLSAASVKVALPVPFAM